MSAKVFSTSIAAFTVDVRAFWIAYIALADAPNAITRALEAASDLSNSPSCPVILPNG